MRFGRQQIHLIVGFIVALSATFSQQMANALHAAGEFEGAHRIGLPAIA
jgi:hypothetical protein